MSFLIDAKSIRERWGRFEWDPSPRLPAWLRPWAITISLLLVVLVAGVGGGCTTLIPGDPGKASEDEFPSDSGGELMPEQASWDVRAYDLKLDIDPDRKSIEGQTRISLEAVARTETVVLDLDSRLRVRRIRQWLPTWTLPRKLSFRHTAGRIWITLPEPLNPGDATTLEVHYHGRPREAKRAPWDGGFVWDQTEDGHPWIATAVQGDGADLWWPCKDHPSDKADRLSLEVTVPQPLFVASNGVLVNRTPHEDGTETFHWVTDYPISNYNVALNIGPYVAVEDHYLSVAGDDLPVTFWVLPEHQKQAEEFLPQIHQHLEFYERTLGPYPFRGEKYGVVETPHLGMEHQTIIAYGNQFRDGGHGYDWLHLHELGHEWWGNLVTADDWRHFWIHEGLCSYMEALFVEERDGVMAYHAQMYKALGRVDSEHPLVPTEPTGIAAMDERVGSDVYFKGAWILHSLRYLIGRDALVECLRRFAYPDSSTEMRADPSIVRFVTSEDYIKTVHRVTGQRFDWFFNVYLGAAGLPSLEGEIANGRLKLDWRVPDGLPFPMPVEVIVDGKRHQVAMGNGGGVLEVGDAEQVLMDSDFWILKERTYSMLPSRAEVK